MYFSVHFSPHVIPIRQCELCLYAKIHKLQRHYSRWPLHHAGFPPPSNVIASAQKYVARIHSFIHKRALSKTFSHSTWCLFNMLAVHWDEEPRLYYWLRSASLACFLSSASLPFFFFSKHAFRKIKIGGKMGGKVKDDLWKSGGCLWRSNWTVWWGWSEQRRKLKSCNVSTTVSGPSTRCR